MNKPLLYALVLLVFAFVLGFGDVQSVLSSEENRSAAARGEERRQQPSKSQGSTPGKERKVERLHVDASKVTEMLDEADVRAFVDKAVRLSDYTAPQELLRVAKLHPDELRRVVCGGRRCGAVAFFDDRTRTVYVDERLDLERSPVAKSYVIHEVLHYFQLLDGKLTVDMSCQERLELELEAYRIQNEYLSQSGSHHVVSTRLLRRMCDPLGRGG